MTQQHPAGWYGQPDGSQRYWDGTQWTNQIVPPNGGPVPGGLGEQNAAYGEAEPKRPWYTKKRVLIPAAVVVLLAAFGALQGGDDPETALPAPTATAPQASEPGAVTSDALEPSPTQESTTSTPAEVAATEAPLETSAVPEPVTESEPVVEEPPADSGGTVSQMQALRQAESYLGFAAFSRTGLIEQLEFEGFSVEDATFAVDALEVDWMVQAEAKALDYLEYSAFSETGLVEQLEFEGFSNAEAVHGVGSVEVDWMEQAALKAADYLEYSAFSRAGLIDQLEFEGFTSEQAVHGADSVGL